MLDAMTIPFDLVQPRRVLFGRERIRGIGDVVREHGNRCWVVTGSRPERASVVSDALVRAQVPHEIWCASGNRLLIPFVMQRRLPGLLRRMWWLRWVVGV